MNLHQLNEAQREAVTFFEKRPLVVVAGPGTGKTRVLTCRIDYLVEEKGINPERILAITFTNHAAREITERIKARHAEYVPKITTFHAWAYELIRQEMGGKGPSSLIDESDAYSLFKEALSLLGMDMRRARRIFKEIERLRQTYPEGELKDNEIAAAYFCYKALLHKYNIMDYDEILIRCMKLLESEPILKRVKTKWPHILVDEFQDVNPIQFKIIETITTGYLTIIGDPNQSIYGFRGSDPRAMERFLENFEDAKVVRLNVAYRCHQEVLEGSSAILTATAPNLTAEKGRGPKIVLKGFHNPREEARWLANEIESLAGALSFEAVNYGKYLGAGEEHALDEIAILLRTWASANDIVNGLTKRGIPYRETRAIPITQDPTARLLAQIFAVYQGENTDFHKKRLQEEAGIGDRLLDRCMTTLKDGDTNKLLEILGLDPGDPFTRGLVMWMSGTAHPLLATDVDLVGIRIHALHLMTIHGAKGLEFPVVFIPRCDADILPLKGSDEDEERRLLYVAMTRAKEQIYITYCAHKKSPFLDGLPEETYLEEIMHVRNKKPSRKGPRQGTLF